MNTGRSAMEPLRTAILKTLLYYDIWQHPLTAREVFRYLPLNSLTLPDLEADLRAACHTGTVKEDRGYYFAPQRSADVVDRRLDRERRARSLWRAARLSMHVIRRFPFVRGVFVSGDLSKNSVDRTSDVDFFIITEPGRLWIARTLLILFKKIFLLNRKKYFCVNSFATADHLELDERSIFLATEIATLTPLYNRPLFIEYMEANSWIRGYFPNFVREDAEGVPVCNRKSPLQRLLELPFRFLPADRLDTALLRFMEQTWMRRYPQYDEATRRRIFRCTRTESRAYAGNFQEKILDLYTARLREAGIAP